MAILAVGDRVLVTINGQLAGQRIMSMFCYGVSSITGTPQQEAAFTGLRNALCATANLLDKYKACCPSNYQVTSLWFQAIHPQRYAKFVLTDTSTGLLSEYSANTPNVAQVITRKGELANRSAISSLHVPCPTDFEWISAGTLQPIALDAMLALATQVRAVVNSASPVAEFFPVINNGPGVGDFTPIVVTQYQTTVRTMRRRTVGLGI